jgi:uncharacterized protein Yka (UPF0111/DUF47 family)
MPGEIRETFEEYRRTLHRITESRDEARRELAVAKEKLQEIEKEFDELQERTLREKISKFSRS